MAKQGKNKTTTTKKRGRPKEAVSDKIDLEMVEKLAMFGFTDADMARWFGLNECTINRYKKDPEFMQVLKRGNDKADTNVIESLYRRAIGYSHPEDKIFNNNGKALIVPTTKHYAPDTTAAIFWLKNRRPEEWRDRQEITGKDGASLISAVTVNVVKSKSQLIE